MGLRNRTGIIGYLFLAGVFSVLLTVLADKLLLEELNDAYSQTEIIISGIAAGNESGEALLKWLKESPDETFLKAGADRMAENGYTTQTQTIWDQKYSAAKNRILAGSILFDVFILFLLRLLFVLYNKRDNARISSLEHMLCRLQTTEAADLDFSDPVLNDALHARMVSLQKQIQADRLQMQQEKEHTKALVTDISHQLKTPVAALKTSIELLSCEDMADTERQEFFAACTHQLDCLENLTASLVGVSRLEKGMIQSHPEPSPIKETILSAVSRLYEKAADKQISIEMTEDTCSETVPVLHDKKWTAEVLVNLLDNAVKYSGRHSKIVIRADELTSYIRISIEDNGIGIPKDEWHKIFKRFYRGRDVRDLEGSGVGLYLARKIVEKQNGTIFVSSKTGRQHGSVFSLQLPKA